MSNIELHWTEFHTLYVSKENVFTTLVDLYENNMGESENIDEIIDWLTDNLDEFSFDFLESLKYIGFIEGEIEEDDIADTILDSKFLDEFKNWYNE